MTAMLFAAFFFASSDVPPTLDQNRMIVAVAEQALDHGGRTNSQGCHRETRTGKTHCH
ncbi:MAG: YHYH domain-containing protein [Pseudomonadota bacterium]